MFAKIKFLKLKSSADISVQNFGVDKSTQAYIDICKHFQMISVLSENDLKTLGNSVGFSPVLDIQEPLVIILNRSLLTLTRSLLTPMHNQRAARYNPAQAGAATHGGNGLCKLS